MVEVPAARSIIVRIQPQAEQYAGWMRSTGVSFGAINEKRGLRGPMSCSSQRGHRVTFGKGIADAGKTASHEEQETVCTTGLFSSNTLVCRACQRSSHDARLEAGKNPPRGYARTNHSSFERTSYSARYSRSSRSTCSCWAIISFASAGQRALAPASIACWSSRDKCERRSAPIAPAEDTK